MTESDFHIKPEEFERGYCQHCGETENIQIETCHLRCLACGNVSGGCGD
jgi:hypothetical protein